MELVRGEQKGAVIKKLADFNDRILGKGVVRCSDTPGFLGNRVGVALQVGINEAINCGLSLKMLMRLWGLNGDSKTGVFGLYDLIGIDLMADVVASLSQILPDADAFREATGNNRLICG